MPSKLISKSDVRASSSGTEHAYTFVSQYRCMYCMLACTCMVMCVVALMFVCMYIRVYVDCSIFAPLSLRFDSRNRPPNSFDLARVNTHVHGKHIESAYSCVRCIFICIHKCMHSGHDAHIHRHTHKTRATHAGCRYASQAVASEPRQAPRDSWSLPAPARTSACPHARLTW
jgi:hypothetical protein